MPSYRYEAKNASGKVHSGVLVAPTLAAASQQLRDKGEFILALAPGDEAGVKKGFSYGATDPFGWKATEKVTTIYDLHATVLYLLGLDHKELTYYHNGTRRRLTDVHGEVIREILAP